MDKKLISLIALFVGFLAFSFSFGYYPAPLYQGAPLYIQSNQSSYSTAPFQLSTSPLSISTLYSSSSGFTQGNTNVTILTVGGASGGTAPYSYKLWKRFSTQSTATQVSGLKISNLYGVIEISYIFQINSSVTPGTYYFQLQATDSSGASIDSNVASVSIYPLPISPTISPLNPTITKGQSVAFSTTWSGSNFPYALGLYSSSSSTCTPSTATELISATVNVKDSAGGFTFPTVTPISNTYYCIVISSEGSGTYSTSPTSLVTISTPSPLTIPTPIFQTTNPMNLGQTAQLVDSGASGGSSGYTYQLFEEAPGSSTYTPIAGQKGTSPDYGIAIDANPGVYHFEIQVTDSSGDTAISGAASLDVIQPTTTSSTTSSTTTSSTIYPTTTNSTTNGTIIYVNHNITSGPWTVVLVSLGAPTASGVSTATFSAYYKGNLVGNTIVTPGTAASFGNATSGIYLYLYQTFPGEYSYQKWARFSIAAYSTPSKKISFIGQKVFSGPWTVVLQNVGQFNSTGTSPAVFAVYYNNNLVNITTINVNGVASFEYDGYAISINVLQTFPGLYSYQKWAGYDIVNGIDLYTGNSTTSGPWKVVLDDLSIPTAQSISDATFSFYYNGVLTNITTVAPGSNAIIVQGNNKLYLTLYNTFPGYANQKWAQFSLTALSSAVNEYALDIISKSPYVSTAPSPGVHLYPAGTNVSISAYSNIAGTSYIYWNGTGVGSYTGSNSNSIITMNGNIIETALIIQAPTTGPTTVPITLPTTTPPITLKTITLNISKGWNLISFPQDANLATSSGTCNNVVKALYFYNPYTQSYIDAYSDNTTLNTSILSLLYNDNYGAWVYAGYNCQNVITFPSTFVQNSTFKQTLQTGWNLIGVPILTNESFTTLLSPCYTNAGAPVLYSYNSSTQNYYNPKTPNEGSGYFVHVQNQCTITWQQNSSAIPTPPLPIATS